MASIIERHALIVANGSTKCTGRITRKRVTRLRTEESSIDIVLFSCDMMDNFKSLLINEKRKHVLTKIRKTIRGTVVQESDHNVLISEFNTTYNGDKKKTKVKLYNKKNPECEEKFRVYTSNTNMLSNVFDYEDNLNILTQRFIKKIDGCIKHSFKKVRVSNNKPIEEEKLYDKMRKLKYKEVYQSANDLKEVIEAIAVQAENKYNKVVTELASMKPQGRKINSQRFWKLKKKICPKTRKPPVAMKDEKGNHLTNQKAIEERAIEVFTERLKPNKMEVHLKSIEETENKLCKMRLKLSKHV